MTLYKPSNMVGSTIASGSSFVHGTDSQINLTDAGDFESEGGYIRIDDGSQWALYEYTVINSDTLTGLSLADYIAESTSSHTFEEGAPVTLEATADLWDDIVSILRGDMAWALQKFSNITGIDNIKSDTAANLSAGISDRICFEEDTGRILYDNGDNFVELGPKANISDDGTEVLTDVTDINFGYNISVTDDEDGSVTVSMDKINIIDGGDANS